jgi:2-polyprenyl-3-methyl-5-hydroxy-6-metoxy-1,4-benzoquinol methylase
MMPMNNLTEHTVVETSRFYDVLASEYDNMTNFEKRFIQEKPFFRLLIDRYGIWTALDAGCGTGFHSMVLAQLGVEVTAADVSGEMLAKASAHAKKMDLRIRTVKSSFQDLPLHIDRKFDAIFCLGNSLVHLLDTYDLEITLNNFYSMLKPDGILFVQIVNYERILAERKKIQNERDSGGVTVRREYEYEEKFIRFTIRYIRSDVKEQPEHSTTVRIRPLVRTDIIPVLLSSGFSDIKTYGGISMIDFTPATAKDLVILAKKGE